MRHPPLTMESKLETLNAQIRCSLRASSTSKHISTSLLNAGHDLCPVIDHLGFIVVGTKISLARINWIPSTHTYLSGPKINLQSSIGPPRPFSSAWAVFVRGKARGVCETRTPYHPSDRGLIAAWNSPGEQYAAFDGTGIREKKRIQVDKKKFRFL